MDPTNQRNDVTFERYYSNKLEKFETALRLTFPQIDQEVSILKDSMTYSLFAEGKRVRPISLLTTIECAGKDSDFALPFACAIEYIHTYSLIHDDLPCMDDDQLRRGKPTNHVRFGEEIALLAGDALLSHCFNLISSPRLLNDVAPSTVMKIIHLLSAKAGIFGMVAGQVADIRPIPDINQKEALLYIHSNKTGALITAAIQIGALLADVNAMTFDALTCFGKEIGTCFQIQDDILDETGDQRKMGKTPGSDKKNQTITYPSVFGLEKSIDLANISYKKALDYLSDTQLNTTRLKQLANFVLKRDR